MPRDQVGYDGFQTVGVPAHPLQLHVDQQSISHRLEDLGQRRDALPGEARVEIRPGVKLLDLGQGFLPHQATAIGGGIDAFVMDHHRHPVARQVDVQLNAIRAILGRQLEGGQRILGRIVAGAAMPEVKYAPHVQRSKG